MPRPHALAVLAILFSQWHSLIAQAQTPPMLEVRVNTPKWVDGCLDLTVERINVSSQTIYLPYWEGLLFLLSTKMIHDDPSQKNDDVWLTVYGLSDMVFYSAQPLAGGSKTTDHFCLPATSAVVNEQRKTRRQVPVRGRLKILASYFPDQEDWQAKKSEKEKQWPTAWPAPAASLEIDVPCAPKSQCSSDCKIPPVIAEGENVLVPDILAFRKDWNERGATLADTLSRQYSTCKTETFHKAQIRLPLV